MFAKATKSMSIYAKIAYILLASTVVIVPMAAGSQYYPIPSTNNQFALFKMVALFVLVGSAFLFAALDMLLGEREVRWHSLMWVALAYVGVTCVSFGFSLDKRLSLFGDYHRYAGLAPTVLTVLLLFLAIQLIRNNSGMRFIMHLSVLTSFLLAGYGLAQFFGVETAHLSQVAGLGRRSFSLYGNANLYATYLCFIDFFAAGLLFSEKKYGWRVVYGVALLVNLAVSFTSMTRSLFLALVIVIPLFVVMLVRQRVKFEKGDKVVLGAGALVGIGLAGISLSQKNSELNVLSRIGGVFTSSGSTGSRIEIWKSALSVIKEYPLFGTGPDTYAVTGMSHLTDRYLQTVGLAEVPNNAHSLFLQLAATIGLLGMLAYFAVALYAVVLSWKHAWTTGDEKQASGKILYASVLCGLLAFLVNSSVSVVDIGSAPFYWLALAYLIVPFAKTKEFKTSAPGALLTGIAAVCFILCVVFPFKLLVADYDFWQGMNSPQASTQQIEWYQKATAQNPFEADFATKYVDAVGGSYIARLSTLTTQDFAALHSFIDEWYSKFPYRFDMQSVASYYYAAVGVSTLESTYLAQAKSLDLQILKDNPRHMKAMADLACIYKVTGDQSKARELYSYIKNTGPDTTIKQESLALIDSVKTPTK